MAYYKKTFQTNNSKFKKKYIKYSRKKTKSNKEIIINDKKINVKNNDLLIFFRQLSIIINSGVTLAEGLELISENTRNKKFSYIQKRIANRISTGDEFSICLRSYPKIFSTTVSGLVEAGEAGGILNQMLDRIANLIENQSQTKGKIIGALIYPIIILVLSLTISLALLIFLVPRFEDLFSSIGADLPLLTRVMLFLSRQFTSVYFLVYFPIIIYGLYYLIKRFYKSDNGRLLFDTTIFKIPILGDLMIRSEMASFCETLSVLLESGIPLVDSLEKAITTTANYLIRKTIKVSTLDVTKGIELSRSLSQSKTFPKLVTSMIKIGEETGELSYMLNNLSRFYQREVSESITSLTKVLEPLVIVFMALIIGTIVISIYLPMFKIITVIGQ